MAKRSDQQRLQDILDAIEKIERYRDPEQRDIPHDVRLGWIVLQLQTIGEASSKLTQQTRELAPRVPWPEIIAMRNILVHVYFGISEKRVEAVVANDLDPLKRGCSQLLAILEQSPDAE